MEVTNSFYIAKYYYLKSSPYLATFDTVNLTLPPEAHFSLSLWILYLLIFLLSQCVHLSEVY